MATRGSYVYTYRDLMAGLKGNKTFDHEIVDMLIQMNPMLDDMVITEANDGTSNKTTIRTGLPDVAWIGFYEGVQGSKGSKKQIRNTAGRAATKLEIDAKLFDSDPNKNALLLDEVQAHSNALMNEMADCIIYGKVTTEPKKFNGLINFYSKYQANSSTDDTVSSHYVFNAKSATQASTAALRSIFLVGWSQMSIRCFYPQGTMGGIQRGPFKKYVDVTDSDGGTYEVHRQYLEWQLGLDVRDYRYGGRMCNLQADEMFDTSGVPDYWEILRRMTTRVRDDGGVRQVYYMDKLTWEAVTVWASRKTAENAIKYGDLNERIPHKLFGIPVRIADSLNTNEDEVSQVS